MNAVVVLDMDEILYCNQLAEKYFNKKAIHVINLKTNSSKYLIQEIETHI